MDLFKCLLRKRRLGCQLVFNREGGALVNLRKSWKEACVQAGIPKMLFHITSDEDLKEAALKRQAFIEGQERQLRFSYVRPISAQLSERG
jgi:hypothetical protein